MKERLDHPFHRVLEAFRHTESFDDVLSPEDASELLLNLAHHYLPFRGARVATVEARVLAERMMTPEAATIIDSRVDAEWIEFLSREFRAVLVPPEEGGSTALHFLSPLHFGRHLLGTVVLVLEENSMPSEWQVQAVEILSRAAGVTLGRFHQARLLANERDHAQRIFSSIVSPLLVTDGKGLIVERNAAAAEVFGSGCTGSDYAGHFRFTGRDPIRECIESGEAQHRVDVPGGDGRIWGITVSPFTFTAGDCGAVVGFRDITDLRRMEDKLAATERQASIGRMAATVAHEVNNPLGAMKAHLRIARKDADERTAQRLDVIAEQIDRIARTMQVMLGFSRQRSASAEAAPIGEVIRTVLALFEGGFREKEIAVEADLPDTLPAVKARVDEIQEVLVNLLENARDALSKGGRVRIHARAAKNTVEIRVEDNGCGLGADPEAVMQPFFTTKTHGTGLGLSIARKICEAHGGRIVPENRTKKEGGGARFRIFLPTQS